MLATATATPARRKRAVTVAPPAPVDPFLDVAEPPDDLPEVEAAVAQIVHHEKPRDYRCTCGRLLCRARLTPGAYVEVRCRKCGKASRWEGGV